MAVTKQRKMNLTETETTDTEKRNFPYFFSRGLGKPILNRTRNFQNSAIL